LALFLALTAGDAALAQTYVVSISGSTPNLGTVVSSANAPDTVWRIDPSSQAVTQQAGGSAVRLSSNLTRATVTVSCVGGGCNNGTVNVHVGTLGSTTNRARKLTNMTVAMGSASLQSSVTGSDPLAFTIDKIGSSPKTFYVGADFGIAPDSSGLGTGTSTSGFYVSVAKSPAWDAASGSGTATAVVYRPIAISQPQALNFGTIVKPRTGTGSISVSKVDGAATISGGVLLSSTKQAKFSITGEGGRQITLQVPSSFNLTGPSTIAVTLDSDYVSPTTLDSSLGNAGSYSFNVGGSFTYGASTPTGSYSGSYSITASYN
jgi:hypothetical protein